MRHPVGHTSNGVVVHVDLLQSEAARHISQQPHLLELASEVLARKSVHGPSLRMEYDMGRTIGYSYVVATTEQDQVFYAQLLQDPAYTRFIKNGKPLATTYLSLVLRRSEDGAYELVDTWIGRLNPPRPGTTGETADSKPYWTSHALILGNQPLQLRSVTKTCPY